MPDRPDLNGRRVLLVEDEYIIAVDLAMSLEEFGAEIVGPVGSVGEALELVGSGTAHLDGAVLDVNLRDERVYPVADLLARQGVPFIFSTGYDAGVTPAAYADVPRCLKPIDKVQVATLLIRQMTALPDA